MALNLAGIGNVGEFYSHHYLDSLLESDMKPLLERWEEAERERGQTSPHKRVSRAAEEYFKAKARILASARDEDLYEESHRLNVHLSEALGFGYTAREVRSLEDDLVVPVLAAFERDGRPYLWVVETVFAAEDRAPLEQRILEAQNPTLGTDAPKDVPFDVWETVIARIFRREEPPRWVILLAGSIAILAERHKWGQGKYLRFDVDDLLGRRDPDALKATAALLSRESLCPTDGAVLHDTLDENSHKHAYSVSEDLKFGVRRAVELLANEYIWYQRNVAKQSLFGDDELARKLTTECLRYLYRLLFLFYAEARGSELDVVPTKSEEYRRGYSLEALRDLEQVPLTTEAAQNGYFFDTSLRQLFRIVDEGHSPKELEIQGVAHAPIYVQSILEGGRIGREPRQLQLELGHGPSGSRRAMAARDPDAVLPDPTGQVAIDYGFTVEGLRSPLFDPKSTPLLSSVRFRNVVLQQVIESLSLSAEGRRARGSRRRERGRISYAELGINQLGAVYEGLLSYGGFFARETLYEVKPAGGTSSDETQQSYFVPESELSKYKDDEIVTEEVEGTGPETKRRRKRYEKGTFVFRLAGRDREKSASYYTPECLTRCVVKYSLLELLEGKSADEILRLTVCEPAMGSGAFLNEALDQLADAYLERKQNETERRIPPSEYATERQRVKAYLATHNCYGVDLNPVAAELAQVSIWLNTIHQGSRCPWFELRMAVGNSLIGARRQVFSAKDISRKASKSDPNWLGLAPDAVPLGPEWKDRPEGAIYHFLLPAEGMAAFDKDDAVRELAPEGVRRIREWRKDFLKPFSKDDARKLADLSDTVDDLWRQVVVDRRRAARETEQPIAVWGQPAPGRVMTVIREMRGVAERILRSDTAYRRLKLAMDYWCALWFWPIDKAGDLPSQDVFLLDLELILEGTVSPRPDAGSIPGIPEGAEVPEEHRDFVKRHGKVDVDELMDRVSRLRTVREVAERVRFHHWELWFAEVFADRGGFDLVLGNPPWVNVEWNESGILSDNEPLLALRGIAAPEVAKRRGALLDSPGKVQEYLSEFVEQAGGKSFLGARPNYPLLEGIRTNLYKCFVCKGWEIGSASGAAGFLHPEGLYDDPKGGALREAAYGRLASHFQFVNELQLFAEVDHHQKYSVNVYRCRSPSGTPDFVQVSNLFHPATADGSFAHDGAGTIPGIKGDDDRWDLRSHQRRLVRVDPDRLATFARLYDDPGTAALQARLPVVHSEEIVAVLEKFAAQPRRLGDMEGEFFSTQMWNETLSQKDGTIRRETRYPKHPGQWILSGPHFYVGNPLYQTPNDGCRNNLDYSAIDLTAIPEDYLPRTNYVPACSPAEYRKRTPEWRGKPVTEYYRHVHREMVSPTGERTLVAALIPPRVGHVHTVLSLCFGTQADLLAFCGFAWSLVCDFFVKSTGQQHVNKSTIAALPFPRSGAIQTLMGARVLRLTCTSSQFRELWNQDWRHYCEIGDTTDWCSKVALRTDFSRRQALVELDALAALALDLTEEELITIYRVQFPVLRQYESEDRYDQTGRLVPREVLRIAEKFKVDPREPLHLSAYRGPPEAVGEVDTPALGTTGGVRWLDPKMEPRMERIYPPPFTRCDREADMRQAYRVFKERLAKETPRT